MRTIRNVFFVLMGTSGRPKQSSCALCMIWAIWSGAQHNEHTKDGWQQPSKKQPNIPSFHRPNGARILSPGKLKGSGAQNISPSFTPPRGCNSNRRKTVCKNCFFSYFGSQALSKQVTHNFARKCLPRISIDLGHKIIASR